MSRTYVIADTHGMYDLLMKAINTIKVNEASNLDDDYKIITLGDYIDRGPDSAKIVDYLMGHPEITAIAGNHEKMLLGWLDYQWDIGNYLLNGGNSTLLSYGQKVGEAADRNAVPKAHINFLKSLPLYVTDKHRIYVHAGVDPTKSLEDQSEHNLTWQLYKWQDALFPLHVVHGHEQHEDGPKLYPGRTNLDTGAYYTGRLAVAVFDDDIPGGPVEIIDVAA